MNRYDAARTAARIKRLQQGDYQFGHSGRHHGNGTVGCPAELHHHHDWFCQPPTQQELDAAGVTDFKQRTRA